MDLDKLALWALSKADETVMMAKKNTGAGSQLATLLHPSVMKSVEENPTSGLAKLHLEDIAKYRKKFEKRWGETSTELFPEHPLEKLAKGL